MSAAAIEASDSDTPNVVSANPWLIAALVALATFMEVLDITVANVALRYIAGGMGVSEDDASWVVTTYLVANAVALTASSFLARALGRKTFFLVCLALFTASSVLCGFAWTLDSLLLFPNHTGGWHVAASAHRNHGDAFAHSRLRYGADLRHRERVPL
jgi:MFS transporter, DHA2 family, multidrug resistance protein